MSRSAILRLAVWMGLVSGFLEGVVLTATRSFPAILASFKGSIHLLWIAPLTEGIIFAGVGCLLAMAVRRWPSFGPRVPAVVSFLGVFEVLSTPKILHPAAAIVLALGLASTLASRLPAGRIRWAPYAAGLAMLVAGCYGWLWVSEKHMAAALPEARGGVSTNVLAVVLDTVRYDRFRNMAASGRLPNLKRLGDEGIILQNAWSVTSWSLPSQASILTGVSPEVHQTDWPGFAMNPKLPTLAEYFASQGYVTGAFSSNASWVTPEYLGRGFLRFRVYSWEDHLRRTTSGSRLARISWEFGLHFAGRGRPAAALTADFASFLDDYPDRPFFAYLCYMDVNRRMHAAFLNKPFWYPDPPTTTVVQAYDEALGGIDAEFGTLLNLLRRKSKLDNTIIAVTSDHGESFGPDLRGDHELWGHGTSLYPEQTRVPLILWAPAGKLRAALPTADPVSIQAIPATLLGLLGMKGPFPGPSLIEPPPNAIMMNLLYGGVDHRSVLSGHWQSIRTGLNQELFDLVSDPTAQTNLSGQVAVPESIQRAVKPGAGSAVSGEY